MPTMSEAHHTFHRQLSHGIKCSGQATDRAPTNKTGWISGHARLKDIVMLGSSDTSDSDASLGSADSSREGNCGRLYLSLVCDAINLIVHLHRAEDLPAKDFSGTADPYVRISLLPDRKTRHQTRVHRRTLNPVFDERFSFPVQPLLGSVRGGLLERSHVLSNVSSVELSECDDLKRGDTANENRQQFCLTESDEASKGLVHPDIQRPQTSVELGCSTACLLQIGVYDFDRFSRHGLIGMCYVRNPLGLLEDNWADGKERHFALDVKGIKKARDYFYYLI